VSAPSGGPSPLRVGGLALIGVGAVAGLIGIASLLPGGTESSPAAPGSTSASASAEAPPGSATAAPTSANTVPVPSFGATPTNGLAAPGSPGTGGTGATGGTGGGAGGTGGAGGAGAVGGSAGGGTTVAKAPLRVYNNSTITGLAARAAQDFRTDGWTVDAVTNYTEQPNGQGVIPTSTVYFRPGTAEQAPADALAKSFGMRSEPRFAGIQDATPGLIVIVTNDFQKR